MKLSAGNLTVLLSIILCSCSAAEYTTTTTVFQDTTISVVHPAYVDTVVLLPNVNTVRENPVEVPLLTSDSEPPASLKLSGTGRRGVKVEVKGNTALVTVPEDTTRKEVSLSGVKETKDVKHLSWLEQLVDDLPWYTVLAVILLSLSFLLWILKR